MKGIVVVTGAAGFIGERTCVALCRDGWQVRAIDAFRDPPRNRAAAERLAGHAVRVEALDLAVDELGPWIRGADRIIHLAARPGVRDRGAAAIHRDNLLALTRLLDALGTTSQTHLLFASSSSASTADPDGTLSYARSKLIGEDLVSAAPVPSTIMRLFSVYGPGQRPAMVFQAACRAMSEGRQLAVFGDGSQMRDWTFVDDVAAALSAEPSPAEGICEVGAGSPTSLTHALRILEGVAQRPLSQHLCAADPLDPPESRADPAHWPVGWVPTTSLVDGLRAQWRSHCNGYAACEYSSQDEIRPTPSQACSITSRAIST